MSSSKRSLRDSAKSADAAKKSKVEAKEDSSSEEDEGSSEAIAPPCPQAGVVLFSGTTDWDLVGRKEAPKGKPKGPVGRTLWSAHQISTFEGLRFRSIASSAFSAHCIFITDDGQTYGWGRNEKGQLGVNDIKNRTEPTLIDTLSGEVVIGASTGKHHTLFLTDKGKVYACGENKMGQCGIGNDKVQQVLVPQLISYSGLPIVKVSCGGEFSVIVDYRGGIHSFGLPEYGQLGHNTDGKYFVTCNKLGYHLEKSPKKIVLFVDKSKEGVEPVEDVDIVDVACGINHALAIDNRNRVFSWGFGGYGRLGHAEQKDEFVPRQIKYFDGPGRGVNSIYAGGQYSLGVGVHGAVYLWGPRKKSGESNMYPKPVPDLNGWKIKSMGCSQTSMMVAADDTLLAWGNAPTYGELATGDYIKSCPNVAEVKPFAGVNVLRVVCGMAFTLLIVDDGLNKGTTPEQKQTCQDKLSKFPIFKP